LDVHLIVDAMNVIGARPDGWWRDRPAARRRLAAEIAGAVPALGAEQVTVVFDGRPGTEEAAGIGDLAALEVLYAPGGPDAADDVIAGIVERAPDPTGIVVVTSDSGLAARVRAAGAGVEGVSSFRRRLEGARPVA
jgi:RNA methyltransferase, TrmH family